MLFGQRHFVLNIYNILKCMWGLGVQYFFQNSKVSAFFYILHMFLKAEYVVFNLCRFSLYISSIQFNRLFFPGEDSRRLVVNEVTNINWTQSIRYCQNQGMLLSSISHDNVVGFDKETIKIHSPSWTALFRDKIVTFSQTSKF